MPSNSEYRPSGLATAGEHSSPRRHHSLAIAIFLGCGILLVPLYAVKPKAEQWEHVPERLVWDIITNFNSLTNYAVEVSTWIKDPKNRQSDSGQFYEGILHLVKQPPQPRQAYNIWSKLADREKPHRQAQVALSELLQRAASSFSPEKPERRNLVGVSEMMLLDAALGGYPPAQWLLAGRYLGLDQPASIPVDPSAALHWLYRAGTNALPQGRLGAIEILLDPGSGIEDVDEEQLKTILVWAKELEKEGNVKASFFIGLQEVMKAETPIEYAAALKQVEKSAQRGHPPAFHLIGNIHLAGLTGKPDFELALKSLLAAAERGHLPAHTVLGNWYYYGYGEDNHSKPDYSKALQWFTEPAEAGDAEAQFHVGLLALVNEENEAKAKFFFEKAVEQGHPEAQLYLAGLLERAAKTSDDYAKVYELYSEASEAGLPRAQYALANIIRSGLVEGQAPESATGLFRRAALQGYPRAELELGNAYLTGSGVTASLIEGLRWYQRAANNLSDEACEKLALMYEQGIGVRTNMLKATAYRARGKQLREIHARHNPFMTK